MLNNEPIAGGAITANFKRERGQGEEEDGVDGLGLEVEQSRAAIR